MNLHEYPRPIHDTGIGVHWCAGTSGASLKTLRAFWLPELRELGVKWVKIADHRQALPLAEELLAAEIMPIVRLRRFEANPNPLNAEQLETVAALVASGVRYIELDHAPDEPGRWPHAQLPFDALTHTARQLAIDLAAISERGGFPGLPALSPGSNWDLVGKLVELGHSDLLGGPVWQATHNFAGNRPLNYPHDPGHREGAPITQEYYLALAEEDWHGDAWQSRDLAAINRLRKEVASDREKQRILPGDQLCWLDYVRLDACNQAHLGRSLPILSTAGGWSVGSTLDPRYPAVTPLLHMAQTLEACRAMMGTSRRHAPAPDFFFCTAFWLLANAALESDQPTREQDAWYSSVWPQNVLPIGPALKAEPKRSRAAHWTGQPAGYTDDEATGAVNTSIELLAPPHDAVATSTIAGQVRGGSEAKLCLVRSDGMLYRTTARADGRYRFVNLAGGRYTLWVEDPPGSRRERIMLDGRNEAEIPLSVDGWGYEVRHTDEDGNTVLSCRVEASAVTAEAGTLAVRLRRTDAPGGSRVVSMARRVDGAATCEIGPLASGEYRVEVLGVTTASGEPYPLEALVDVHGPTGLAFLYSRPAERGFLHLAQVFGHVANSTGGSLILTDAQGKRWEAEVDQEGRYQFENLPPGVYALAIAGVEPRMVRSRIGLDGKNQVQIDLDLPIESASIAPPEPQWGALEVHGPDIPGVLLRLIGKSGEQHSQQIAADGTAQFERLLPGTYTLSGSGYWQPGLEIYPNRRLLLHLPAHTPLWEANVAYWRAAEDAGMVRVQVPGRSGTKLTLFDARGRSRRAEIRGDSDFCAYFGPLQPGRYIVAAEALDVQTEIHLPRASTATVIFRRSGTIGGALQIRYVPLNSARTASAYAPTTQNLFKSNSYPEQDKVT